VTRAEVQDEWLSLANEDFPHVISPAEHRQLVFVATAPEDAPAAGPSLQTVVTIHYSVGANAASVQLPVSLLLKARAPPRVALSDHALVANAGDCSAASTHHMVVSNVGLENATLHGARVFHEDDGAGWVAPWLEVRPAQGSWPLPLARGASATLNFTVSPQGLRQGNHSKLVRLVVTREGAAPHEAGPAASASADAAPTLLVVAQCASSSPLPSAVHPSTVGLSMYLGIGAAAVLSVVAVAYVSIRAYRGRHEAAKRKEYLQVREDDIEEDTGEFLDDESDVEERSKLPPHRTGPPTRRPPTHPLHRSLLHARVDRRAPATRPPAVHSTAPTDAPFGAPLSVVDRYFTPDGRRR